MAGMAEDFKGRQGAVIFLKWRSDCQWVKLLTHQPGKLITKIGELSESTGNIEPINGLLPGDSSRKRFQAYSDKKGQAKYTSSTGEEVGRIHPKLPTSRDYLRSN